VGGEGRGQGGEERGWRDKTHSSWSVWLCCEADRRENRPEDREVTISLFKKKKEKKKKQLQCFMRGITRQCFSVQKLLKSRGAACSSHPEWLRGWRTRDARGSPCRKRWLSPCREQLTCAGREQSRCVPLVAIGSLHHGPACCHRRHRGEAFPHINGT